VGSSPGKNYGEFFPKKQDHLLAGWRIKLPGGASFVSAHKPYSLSGIEQDRTGTLPAI